MLLRRIVSEIDGELVRLKALRAVVAGLARTPAIVQALPAVPGVSLQIASAGASLPAESAALSQHPKRQHRESPAVVPFEAVVGLSLRPARRPERRAGRKRPAESGALAKAAVAGPVVVSAAALARERAERETVHPATPAKLTRAEPEVFARQLAARWLTPASKP